MTGTELKKAREAAGMTQGQLGRRIGIATSKITRMENWPQPIQGLDAKYVDSLAKVLKRCRMERPESRNEQET